MPLYGGMELHANNRRLLVGPFITMGCVARGVHLPQSRESRAGCLAQTLSLGAPADRVSCGGGMWLWLTTISPTVEPEVCLSSRKSLCLHRLISTIELFSNSEVQLASHSRHL